MRAEDGTGADTDSGDYLNGGGGDDMIAAGQGDIVTAGAGADSIAVGDWITGGNAAQIMDFSTEEDSLIVVYDDADGGEANVTLHPDEDGTGRQHVLLNGLHIASVENAGDLTLDHIALIPQSVIDTTLAG